MTILTDFYNVQQLWTANIHFKVYDCKKYDRNTFLRSIRKSSTLYFFLLKLKIKFGKISVVSSVKTKLMPLIVVHSIGCWESLLVGWETTPQRQTVRSRVRWKHNTHTIYIELRAAFWILMSIFFTFWTYSLSTPFCKYNDGELIPT